MWVAQAEAFTKVPKDAAERVFWYAMELLVRLRMPVRATVLLMSEKHAGSAQMAERFEVRMGGFTGAMEFHVVNLWEVPAGMLLATDRPRLLSWTPLTNASEEDLRTASRRLREMRNQQALDTFQVVGEIRYGKDIWLEAIQHLEGNMSLALAFKELYMDSETVQEIVAEAAAQAAAQAAAKAAAQAAAETDVRRFRDLVLARFPDAIPALPADEAISRASNFAEVFRAVAVAGNRDEALRAIALIEGS